MVSILLAESDHLFRDGLRRILESSEGLNVVAEACDEGEIARAVAEHPPDVALVTFGGPSRDGSGLLATVRSESPRTHCVALAKGYRPGMVRDALAAGALGFLLRSSTSRQLLAAIDAVGHGRPYLAPEVTGEVVTAFAEGRTGSDRRTLTDRQSQVLHLIVEGFSTKEIASELGISIGTAQTHRATLMTRFGVHKTSSLVRGAIRDGHVAA